MSKPTADSASFARRRMLPRILSLAVALLALASLAAAQAPPPLPPTDLVVRTNCEAPQISGGPEFEEVHAIVHKLALDNVPKVQFAVTYAPLFHTWEIGIPQDTSLVCISSGLVHALGNHEGQLAFVIAHEFGHALDSRCKAADAEAIDHSAPGTALVLLFGKGAANESRNLRACESRADELGLRYITRAGYEPQDAIAALELIGNYSADRGTGIGAHIAQADKDHPLISTRIRRLRKLIAGQTKNQVE